MSNQAACRWCRAGGKLPREKSASCMVNSFLQYTSQGGRTLSTSYVHSTRGKNGIGDEESVSPDRSELGIHGDFKMPREAHARYNMPERPSNSGRS
jgi:hypothetical protein